METMKPTRRKVNFAIDGELAEFAGLQAIEEGLGYRPSLIVENALREYREKVRRKGSRREPASVAG